MNLFRLMTGIIPQFKRLKPALIILIMFLFTHSVSASTVAEVTEKVMKRFGISVQTEDFDNLRFYKNHGLVDEKYKPLLSSAVRAGVLVPSGGILAPESEDLTSVRNGLVNFGLKNPYVKIVAGKFQGYKISDAVVNKETLPVDELTEGDVYTALVDRQNNIVAAWKPAGLILPTLYRAKLYIKADNMMVVYETERSSYDMWIPDRQGEFIEVDLTGTTMGTTHDDIINMEFMDEIVYFVGEGFKY